MIDLLKPISDLSPAGDDLTFSPEFDAIAEARRHDDPSLAQGDWTQDVKLANWQQVLCLCEALLETRTKDLRVAGWYAEAATHLRGFEGLAAGYRLVACLCRDLWDDIHPFGDNEERAGSLQWLMSQSAQWIRKIPLGGDTALQDLAGGRGHRAEDVVEKLAAWRRAVPDAHRTAQADEARATAAALTDLENQVRARLHEDAPSFTAAFANLDQARDVLTAVASPEGQPAKIATAAAPVPRDITSSVQTHAHHVQSRTEALQALRDVARFFRDTEPHSPVAYLADKAARWGDMPLHEWLRSVLGEGDTLGKLNDLLGIEKSTAKP